MNLEFGGGGGCWVCCGVCWWCHFKGVFLCQGPPAFNRSVSRRTWRTTPNKMISYDDHNNNGSLFPSPPPTNQLSSSPSTAPITPVPALTHQLPAPPPPLLLVPMAMATSVHSPSTSTVLLTPSSSASSSSPCHRVHFDKTCVLIPEATEPPALRLTAKTYAIPTWARLPFHEPPTITVKLPRLDPILHSDREPPLIIEPSLGKPKHKHSHCPQRLPLQPCLRHSHSSSSSRSDSARDGPDDVSPPISPRTATRRSVTSDSHLHAPVQTVPLRDCCEACLASVDKALQADYSEHFTKAAARRRRMSDTDLPSAVPRPLLPHNVKVDEAEYARFSAGPLATQACGNRPVKGKSLEKPMNFVPPTMAIEEDEDLLFPLPSPRRTPISSSPSDRSPANGTRSVSSSPNLRPIDSPLPLSPCALSKALSETVARQETPSPDPSVKGKPTEIRQSRSELSGKPLLQKYPGVDALPAHLQPSHGGRRSASESPSMSPSRRRNPGFNNIIRPTDNATPGLGNTRR